MAISLKDRHDHTLEICPQYYISGADDFFQKPFALRCGKLFAVSSSLDAFP